MANENQSIIGAGQDAAHRVPKMDYNDKFTFGKHKGKSVISLLNYEYRYLWWIYIKKIRTFDDLLIKQIEKSLEHDANCDRVSRAQGAYSGADAYEAVAGWL
jgi:hypothetical protein